MAINIQEKNNWCKVESIYRLNTPSKMIKICFETSEMAQRAIREGIYILNQSIPARNVEKEIFIKLKPCYNCFSYDHLTNNCSKEKMTICANCASEGHKQNNCTSNEQKCLNCGGNHRTLAAACPKRKELIKTKSKELRERSRSRSRARPGASPQIFADVTGENVRQKTPNITTQAETKELTATILTAVVTSHYSNTMKPGSFQNTFDKIMSANGLPRVIIPIDDILREVDASMEELIKNIRNKQGEKEKDGEARQTSEEMEITQSQSQKRTRNVDSPQESTEKRQKEDLTATQTVQRAASMDMLLTPAAQQHYQKLQMGKQHPTVTISRRDSVGKVHNVTTRELGISVYIRDREKIDLKGIYEDHNEDKRERIARMVSNKRAIVTWAHPKFPLNAIRESFDKKLIRLTDIKYHIVSDIIFNTLKSECVTRPPPTRNK